MTVSWLDRILLRVLPFFILRGKDGSPYMFRYYLARLPWFKIHLHHIVRSDEDPELHDHPWDFTSIVLWSGYTEVTAAGRRRIRAGAVVRHRASDAHRLELERPAWTLVFLSRKKRTWGFYRRDGWTPSRKFFEDKYGPGNYVVH